ncbi:MAG: hypothetical protein A2017_02025 [Lentisphaerae bacterium GWF2_44_16]|nr:MAG: hypothetical protein A2017_02025 [Lentisphaerae bacterium GWF2_44_16]
MNKLFSDPNTLAGKLKKSLLFFNVFTMIEILIVITITFIILNLSMPALKDARDRARFTRWYAFNKVCSRDPDCVLNYDMQEGLKKGFKTKPSGTKAPQGDYLATTTEGGDVNNKRYDARAYNAYFMKNAATPTEASNVYWVPGRWPKWKSGILLNGSDAYVEVRTRDALSFGNDNSDAEEADFTVLCWVKMLRFQSGGLLFAKTLWQDVAMNTSTSPATVMSTADTEFDMYCTNTTSNGLSGNMDVDVGTKCVTFKTAGLFKVGTSGDWVHIALRCKGGSGSIVSTLCTINANCYTYDAVQGKYVYQGYKSVQVYLPRRQTQGVIDFFLNGKPVDADPSPWSTGAQKSSAETNVILGWQGKKPDASYSMSGWFANVIMDEFIVYKRALSDSEIKGHYTMGKP